ETAGACRGSVEGEDELTDGFGLTPASAVGIEAQIRGLERALDHSRLPRDGAGIASFAIERGTLS
ncbi:hypothetical protein ABTM19_19750, partial [Acinetobacter baumannii]